MSFLDSDISKFCFKIQAYRKNFAKLLEVFLNKRYVVQSDCGSVSIESTSKLQIVSVTTSPDSIKDKQKLENLLKSCIEKTFEEHIKNLESIKSEFSEIKDQLTKEYDLKYLDSSNNC